MAVSELEKLIRLDRTALSAHPTLVNAVRISTDAFDASPAPTPHSALVRYALRMGGRATPFGLLAGTAPCGIGERRRLHVGTPHARLRLDAEVLTALVDDVVSEAPLRTNPSLWECDSVLRFQLHPGRPSDAMREVRNSPMISRVLTLTRECHTAEELVDALQGNVPGLTRDKASRFIRQLEDAHILVREVGVICPGTEPAHVVAEHLLLASDPRGERIQQIADESLNLVEPASVQRVAEERWTRTFTEADFPSTRVHRRFHVDLEFDGHGAELDRSTTDSIERACATLIAYQPADSQLDTFVERFKDRYEGCHVPLLAALDPDRGLWVRPDRYASDAAHASGIALRDGFSSLRESERLTSEAFVHWQASGDVPDLVDLGLAAAPDHRDAFDTICTLIGEGSTCRAELKIAVRRGIQALVARFALSRLDLEDSVLEAAKRVEHRLPHNVIVAELATWTGGRTTNVMLRPRLYRETIDVFGSGGGTIRLADLTLGYHDGRLWLHHAPTDRWVIPALSSAVNTRVGNDLPISYRFLAALSEAEPLMWTWGPYRRVRHLPRVVHGDVILSPERWLVKRANVAAAFARKSSVGGWLRDELPGTDEISWLGIVDGDQVLPFHLQVDSTVEAALERASRGPGDMVLVELPHLEHPAISTEQGLHSGEVVLSFDRRDFQPPARVAKPTDRGWMSFHVYGAVTEQDELLLRIADLARGLELSGELTSWFFIRYADPNDHLRIRMLPRDRAARVAIFAAVDSFLTAEAGATYRISAVTWQAYRAEVNRYGGNDAISAVEDCFALDSQQLVDRLGSHWTDSQRLFAVVSSIVSWAQLTDEPLELVRTAVRGFWREFERSEKRNALGAYYASVSTELLDFIDDDSSRTKASTAALSVALEVVKQGRVEVLQSIIHMHANRWLRVDQRRQELLAYELARRVITSRSKGLSGAVGLD